ncbi:hypothetical protein C8Q77DRAFT_1063505 [Trametes polyzona]|nr:hypothetical protein C8Q77DRAFT_1063505 [Trametes polyzona]
MSQPYRLPPRGATGAPSFEPEHPETLLDFFEDLEYMLEQAEVSDDQKRKEHAVRYAPSTQKTLWRGFEEFDDTKPYESFKAAVIKEYLGEDGKRLYSLGDLKALISTHAAKGFRSSSEFKVYSRSFRVIADYLVKHEVIRKDDRDRYFIKALPEPLRAAVLDRLKYKCPDVLAPRVPYTVEQVTAAAGQVPPPIKVSTESLAIRAIEGTFQHDLNVSCILDSGSAIVSMSEGLCHKLGLAFDPSVVLHMQSANGELNPSLGLARNVPVRFGSIVVYLQFHVIRSPAYDVLLGRPFDVLTESIVQTFGDGSQTITPWTASPRAVRPRLQDPVSGSSRHRAPHKRDCGFARLYGPASRLRGR